MHLWLILAIVLATLAIGQSALLLLQTWEHRRYARSSMRSRDYFNTTGRAMIIAPCKGEDVGLLDNLRAILQQDYADYEIVFVVESDDDPACVPIRWAMAEHPHRTARLVIAGRATESGQKVHNLHVATGDMAEDIAFLAFVDSDARPRPEWLRLLLARLDGKHTYAAATGYRWFMPARPTLANLMLSSLNCGIMMLLSHNSHYLVWGGSWAIRRERFDEIAIRDAWCGTLSDDLMAARVLRLSRQPTRFEPVAVVASPVDVNLGRMLEFVRRQYMVTRFYTPHWWWLGLAAMALPNLAWAALAAMFVASLTGETVPLVLPLVFGLVLYGLGVARAALRQSLVATYFPERFNALWAARWFDLLAGPITGFVHWGAMIAAGLGNRIIWRGLTYRLFYGGGMRLEGREPTAPSLVDQREAA